MREVRSGLADENFLKRDSFQGCVSRKVFRPELYIIFHFGTLHHLKSWPSGIFCACTIKFVHCMSEPKSAADFRRWCVVTCWHLSTFFAPSGSPLDTLKVPRVFLWSKEYIHDTSVKYGQVFHKWSLLACRHFNKRGPLKSSCVLCLLRQMSLNSVTN